MKDTWQKLADIYTQVRREIQEDYKKEEQSEMFDEVFKSELRYPERTAEDTGTKLIHNNI